MSQGKGFGSDTYGKDAAAKQRMETNPRMTLATSRPSWAHSLNTSMTQRDPLGHPETFPGGTPPQRQAPMKWGRESASGSQTVEITLGKNAITRGKSIDVLGTGSWLLWSTLQKSYYWLIHLY